MKPPRERGTSDTDGRARRSRLSGEPGISNGRRSTGSSASSWCVRRLPRRLHVLDASRRRRAPLGHPLLWPQEVTSTFFIYGVFVGAAVATRRNDHLYLSARDRGDDRAARAFFEVFNRLVVLVVGICLVDLRLAEFPHRLRQLPHALDAADRLSLSRPFRSAARSSPCSASSRSSTACAMASATEQSRPTSGRRKPPEPCRTSVILIVMTVLFLVLGYLGVPVAFALTAGVMVGSLFTPITLQSIVGQMFNGIDSEALMAIPVLPARRRADDLGQCGDPHRRAVAGPRRPYSRRPRPGHDRVQHVLLRHVRLVIGRCRRAEPHHGASRCRAKAISRPSSPL